MLNLSFVLHERSDSRAVHGASRACQSHARLIRRIEPGLATPETVDEHAGADASCWLTATLGLPHLLATALRTSDDNVLLIDTNVATIEEAEFFRAPARLALPNEDTCRVGVAALLLRPGGRSSHLAIAGVHDWPDARAQVIRSLERLIQTHVGQWLPSRRLWSAPAEALLSDEVY